MLRLPTLELTAGMALAAALAAPVAARATTIMVSTHRDVVADDGRCSLREAVTAANADAPSGASPGECAAGQPAPVVDVVQLRRGTYKLSLGGPGDDANLGGDLDVTSPVVIRGKRRTAIRNAIGAPAVRGDGDRLFHVDPAGSGGVDVTFSSVRLMKGDVGCAGAQCRTGASALEATGDGALVLEDCGVIDNFASCDGDLCGDLDHGAAIRTVAGGSLTIRRSAIRKNRTRCSGDGCRAGDVAILMADLDEQQSEIAPGDLVLEDTVVHRNSSRCEGEACDAGGFVTSVARTVAVGGTTLADNRISCEGKGCRHDNGLALFSTSGANVGGLALRDNVLSCAGPACATATLLQAQGGAADLEVRSLVAERNALACEGTGCTVGQHVDLVAAIGSIVAEAVRFDAATSLCEGGSCVAASLLAMRAGAAARLADAVLVGAGSEARGDAARSAPLVDVRGDDVEVVRTDVAGSLLSCTGESCRAGTLLEADAGDALDLDDVFVVGNGVVCRGDDCVVTKVLDGFSEGNASFERVAVDGNEVLCAGARCQARPSFDVASEGNVRFYLAQMKDALHRCEGTECRLEPMMRVAAETASLDLVTIERNDSSCEGDACRGAPIVLLDVDTATVTGSALSDNRSECRLTGCAGGLGGALHNAARKLTVSDSTFAGNRSDGVGAGLYNAPSSELVLQRVSVLDNQAGLGGNGILGGAGGGIYNDAANGESGLLRVLNSTIRGNAAAVAGGGILNEGVISTFAGSQLGSNEPEDCRNVGGGVGC